MNDKVWRRIGGGGWRCLASWLLSAALLVLVAFYARRAVFNDRHAPVHLVVYAFSTQEEVFSQQIFPAFEQAWEAETGRDLIIEGVFGASGTLAGQINLGAPADVAIFSHARHADWLKLGRRVRHDSQPVVIGCTPLAIVVRAGNPAGIGDYADLTRPGLRLIHADPRTSGAGEWAVLAEYGSALRACGDPAAARAQLQAIWGNVRLLAPSARAALSLFELGAGDALMTYEQDARLASDRGLPLEIVLPPRTVVAQPVAVLVDDNVTAVERPAAQAFVEYLLSDAGQRLLSRYHLRPVSCQGDPFPPLVQPLTVDDLGGWPQAYPDLVEKLWQAEIEPHLNLEPASTLLGIGE